MYHFFFEFDEENHRSASCFVAPWSTQWRESTTKAEIMSKDGSLFKMEKDFTPLTGFKDNLARRALIRVSRFVLKGKTPLL